MAGNQERQATVANKGRNSGTLYLVGTPIGNLEDITLRALRILKEVDLIACEDTRQTAKLLTHYAIATRTISYHEHNEPERAAELQSRLASGENIAVVTDAGMPGISDPGYRIVVQAIAGGAPVVPVPGSAAFLSALVASGLPTDAFAFRGFLPAKEGARRTVIERLRAATHTEIFYEAPHRIVESMRDVVAILGPARPIVIAREVTKLHEEFIRGTAGEVLANLEQRGEVKGEITLLIGKANAGASAEEAARTVTSRIRELMNIEKLDEKTALKTAAKEFGMSKSEAYREWQRRK